MSLGSRRRTGGRGDLPMNAEINVTSLVDVAFTLLVIFIITAPILQGGIEVPIPRADVQPLTSQDAPFFVSVQGDGQIFMEETPVTLEELGSSLGQLLTAGEIERVFLRVDSLLPFGTSVRVMATVQRAGVPVALVAEPWTGNR